jgi:hypothetical protein
VRREEEEKEKEVGEVVWPRFTTFTAWSLPEDWGILASTVLITPFHGPSRKHRFEHYLYCCMRIRCRGNVFTKPLNTNGSTRYNIIEKQTSKIYTQVNMHMRFQAPKEANVSKDWSLPECDAV